MHSLRSHLLKGGLFSAVRRLRPGIPLNERPYTVGACLALTAFVAAVWGTWPMAAHLGTHVFDPEQFFAPAVFRRDMYLMPWAPAWNVHALTTDPMGLFDANILHPARLTLATLDHIMGALPMYFPLAIITDNPVFAHQATLVLTFACAFFALSLLVYDWTASFPAAILAGALYAFCPFRAGNLAWLNLEGGYYLPLLPLLARYAVVRPEKRWPILFGLSAVLQALHSYYLGYAAFLSVGVLAAIVIAFDPVARRHWARILVPTAVAVLVVAASMIPYYLGARDGTIPDSSSFSPKGAALGFTRSAPLAIYLAGFAVLFWRRGVVGRIGGAWPLALVGMALCAHAFSLGSWVRIGDRIFTGPYAWFVDYVPGLYAIRVPARFDVVTTMALAALAGIAVAGCLRWLRDRLPPRFGRAQVLLGLVPVAAAIWSVQSFLGGQPIALRPIETRDTVAPVYRWLADQPRGAVLDLPFQNFVDFYFAGEQEALRAYRSVYHWQPILNGFSGYAPRSYRLVHAMSSHLPDRAALDRLVSFTGVRYIILEKAITHASRLAEWRATKLPRKSFESHTVYIVGPSTPGEDPLVVRAPGEKMTAGESAVSLAPLTREGQRGSLSNLLLTPRVIAGWANEASVMAENQSGEPWVGIALPGSGGVSLTYEIRNAKGKLVSRAIRATPLGIDIGPGERARVPLWFNAPGPGDYQLEIRLVQDEGDPFDPDLAPPLVTPLRTVPIFGK